jgi:hypothetical protein
MSRDITFLVSSGVFHNKILNIGKKTIVRVAYYEDEGILILTSDDGRYAEIPVETLNPVGHVETEHKSTRWDWVLELLGKVGDQPVVVRIRDNSVQIRFDY